MVEFTYEDELLGTAGTVGTNKEFCDGTPVLVAHADNFMVCDLNKFVKAHSLRAEKADITMMTFETQDPQSCGVIEFDAEGGISAFHEKVENPPSNIANGAVFIFEPTVVEDCANMKKIPCDISVDIIAAKLERVHTWQNECYHRDIGTIASLDQARRDAVLLRPKMRNLGWF